MTLQQEMLRQRSPFVLIGLVVVGLLLLLRVISFQFPQDPRVMAEFAAVREASSGSTERVESDRGQIFDRNGNPLAVNTRQYRIFVSPNLISNPARTASQLALILNQDEFEIYEILNSDETGGVPLGVVDPTTWQEIRNLDLFGIKSERVHRRLYPQGTLGAQVIGFVYGTGEEARGAYGVEGYYNQRLSGRARDQEVSNIPFDIPEDVAASLQDGASLVLTLDRDVQFLVESELQRAVTETGSLRGTIIVMNPRNGDILAMASYPSYDPNAFYEVSERDLRNPTISDTYEPGSVFKLLTVAAALDTGTITPDWTYNDTGVFEIGGIRVQNWDRQAHGIVDTTQVLVKSLNVGTSVIAREMGWETFYERLDFFGIGRLTRVDLEGEEAGILRTPNDLSGEWSESDLATNSFGQGLSVTSLQMLAAVNAIANDGLMMKPRVVSQIVDGDTIYDARTTALERPISAETAHTVTDMMVNVVNNGLDEMAQVPGYTVAAKTGTAQIWGVVDYLPDLFIMSVIGFLPADDPQVSVLYMLDRPRSGRWASQVVAPYFSDLVSRLVVLLEIPADDMRGVLVADGTGQ